MTLGDTGQRCQKNTVSAEKQTSFFPQRIYDYFRMIKAMVVMTPAKMS